MDDKDQPRGTEGISSQAGLSAYTGGQAKSLPSVPLPGQPGSRFKPVEVSREEQAARREKKSLKIDTPSARQPGPEMITVPEHIKNPGRAAGGKSTQPGRGAMSAQQEKESREAGTVTGPGRSAPSAQPGDSGVAGAAVKGFTGGFMAGAEGALMAAPAAAGPKAVMTPEHIAGLAEIDGHDQGGLDNDGDRYGR